MRQRYRFDVRIHLARLGAIALIAGSWPCAVLAVDYRVIAEQNLFDPQRKPWAEIAPASAAAASPLGPEDIQVQGVVVHGGVKRAIVKFGGRLRQLAPGGAAGRFNAILGEGQAIGGYTLESIQAQQLVFVSGGNRYTVPLTRNAPREIASAQSAPLPVIQSATLPVAEPMSVPAAQPAAAPQFAQPRSPVTPQQPQQFPPTGAIPAPAQTAQGAGQFPGAPAQQAGNTAAAPAAPAAAPTAPAGGMSLLEAIQAAEAARRSGQAPAAPPFNPFQPRP